MKNDSSGLAQKAEKLIAQHGMINAENNVLVAFSGGSDSSALLFFLFEYMQKKQNLFAAHVNHMIRGDESERDELFSVEICERYGIKIFTKRIDVPKIARDSKKGLEEAARDERYAFLREVAESLGKNTKIATAHTASDNAETLIFNLARGCGLLGLSGIAPTNKNIIRPLLSCEKEDILSYLKKNNIAYAKDSTNADEGYTRNFIRHNITKKLKDKFAKSDENIFKATQIVRETADFMDALAQGLINESGEAELGDLLTRHKALQRAVIAKLYENAVFPDNKKLEYRHIACIESFLEKAEKSEKSLDMPGLVTVRIANGKLKMEKSQDKKTSRNRS
ncbi:MAG: tRNA lysidine(34) synthetase TilS [Oscillospiraceae bacterium]|nr:tRNA lysidine(34) synthetase TilS [Oscillospiraceae bacterium]